MQELPRSTLRNLGLVLVVAFETARTGLRAAVSRIHPHLRPPPDLRVESTEGHTYTGLLLVDDNDVFAGIVSRTGRASERHEHRHRERPLVTPGRGSRSPLFDDDLEDEDDCKLPSWASDPREGGHRW